MSWWEPAPSISKHECIPILSGAALNGLVQFLQPYIFPNKNACTSAPEKLQRSAARKTGASPHQGALLKSPESSETSQHCGVEGLRRTSQHYGIKGLRRTSQHCGIEGLRKTSQYYGIEGFKENITALWYWWV